MKTRLLTIKRLKYIFMIILFINMYILVTTDNKAYAADIETLKNSTRMYFYSEITKDTGCGDCILLENYDKYGTKRYGLIDAGIKRDENGKQVTSVRKFLESHNVTKLEFLFVTHNHADHNGDVSNLINWDKLQINKIYMNTFDTKFVANKENRSVYENIVISAAAKKIKIIGVSYPALKSSTICPTRSSYFIEKTKTVKEELFEEFNKNNTTNISFGSAKIQIFNWEIFDKNGNQLYIKKIGTNNWEYQDSNGKKQDREVVGGENENSLGLLLTQGSKKAFFAGDMNNCDKKEATATSPARVGDEDRIKDNIGDIDFLKVGHHGNDSSTTEDFFNVLKPEYAVISNDMGRAHKDVVDLMKKNNVEYLYTTQDKYEISATITNDKIYLGLGTEKVINKIKDTVYYVQEGAKYKNYKDDLYKVKYKQKKVNVNSWEQLKTEINNNKNNKVSINNTDKTYTVYELIVNLKQGGDWTANSKIDIATQQKVVLTSSENITITRGTSLKNEPLFLINGNLSIGSKDMTGTITIDGNKGKVTSSATLINVELGDLNIYNKVKLCKNFNKATKMTKASGTTDFYTPFGSAIFAKNGNINMYGGEISNNSQKVACEYELPEEISRFYYFCTMGAGVYLESTSLFNMYGGRIVNNKAENQSKVRTNSKYTDSIKDRGIKQQCYGVGIYASRSSEVNLEHGEIKNNQAFNTSVLQLVTSTTSGKTTNLYNINNSVYGAGICTDLSYLTISNDFVISDNSATQSSNITLQKNTKVKLNALAAIRGLQVYLGSSDFKTDGGIISSGKSSSNAVISNQGSIGSSGTDSVSTLNLGGGLYIASCSNVNINNLQINNCNSDRGAGMYLINSNATISNSNISQNQAMHGGGLFIAGNTSRVNIINSKINNNTATTESGGGIYTYGKVTIEGENTEISNNKAEKAGGGIRTNTSGEVTINGGKITNNISNGTGGGIHADGMLTINGGTITGNSARTKGGGIKYTNNKFFKNGGIISDNNALIEGDNIYPVNRAIAEESEHKQIIINLSDCKIEGIAPTYYTGKEVKLNISVTNGNEKLTQDTHYKVTYKNNINIGEGTVIIEGIGNCIGSVSKKFRIIKKASINIDKEYFITSVYAKGRAIDTKNGSLQNGNNMVTNTLNCGNSQKFKFIKNDDGSYNIQNTYLKNYIQTYNTSTKNTSIILTNTTENVSKKWYIGQNTDGTVSFYTADGLVIEASGEKNNSIIKINNLNNNTSQKFTLKNNSEISSLNIDTNKYYYILSSINNKKAVDVYGGRTANLTNVDIYDLNKTNAQKFKFEKNSDGSYSIINKASQKALDVYGNGTSNKTNVDIYTSNKTTAQKWYIIKNSDGTITFLGAESAKALDLYGASVKNFNNIDIWNWNQSNAQKWKLMQE